MQDPQVTVSDQSELRLYVTGSTLLSTRAIENIEALICEELRGAYVLAVGGGDVRAAAAAGRRDRGRGGARNALRAYALEHRSPAAVVDHLDSLIHHLEPKGMATMIYLVYEYVSGTLTFAAGHPYPLLVGANGDREFLQGGRSMPLGTGWRDRRADSTVILPPAPRSCSTPTA